jgi:HK97 family phage major capsid protein
MAKRSETIGRQWAAKLEERDAIFKKYRDSAGNLSGGPDAEENAKLKSLNAEIAQLKSDFDTAKELEEANTASMALLREMKQPVNPLRFPGAPMEELEERAAQRGQQPGQVAFEGSVASGFTVLDLGYNRKSMQLERLAVAYEEGEYGIDRKKLAAISSVSYKSAFRNYIRHGLRDMAPSDYKVLQEGTDPLGGFAVPEDFQNLLVQKQPAPTRLAGQVRNITTSRDAAVLPKINYTADDIYTSPVRITKTGEVPPSSTAHRASDPQMGQVKIPVSTTMLSLLVTQDMIEDSAFPIVSWIADNFAEARDLFIDDNIVNGNAINTAAGILLNPGGVDQPSVVVSGAASALTADGLISAAYSLVEQYEENARWVMNRTSTGLAIAQLKDSANRYLFSGPTYGDTGIASARPVQLLGYPIVWSAFMPNVQSNAFPLIFGDLRGFYSVSRIGFSVQVLDELYAELNQRLVLGRMRWGGQVVEPWRLKIQKVSV